MKKKRNLKEPTKFTNRGNRLHHLQFLLSRLHWALGMTKKLTAEI